MNKITVFSKEKNMYFAPRYLSLSLNYEYMTSFMHENPIYIFYIHLNLVQENVYNFAT
jgi:hypothetical protein